MSSMWSSLFRRRLQCMGQKKVTWDIFTAGQPQTKNRRQRKHLRKKLLRVILFSNHPTNWSKAVWRHWNEKLTDRSKKKWEVHNGPHARKRRLYFQSATNSYGSTSDIKLKENIEDSGSQWDDIKAVKVKKYSMKEDNADAPNRIGVIAQDLEAAGMNGLVKETPDVDFDTKEDLGTTTKSVKYSILYMKAIKALQEAMARIETLETQNTTQATQIADLITRVEALEAE